MSALSGLRKAARETKIAIWLTYYRAFKPRRTLSFQGEEHTYLYKQYNATFANERAVEVPIAWDTVQRYPAERVLEVGNVLSHYYGVRHDILDKYEQAAGVTNADVVDFQPGKQYDLIVSISTLEHVGWDEQPRDPAKFLRAIEHLTTLLAPGGKLLVTLPVGYNPEVDRCLKEGCVPFTAMGCVKRVSRDNLWHEVEWREVEGARYIRARPNPLSALRGPTATAVVVGEIVAPEG